MNPFAELISIIIGIYVNIVLLRFFLQYFRADFYNPLSQFVVKATDPFIKPLRKVIPGIGGLDFSSLVLAWLVSLVNVVLLSLFDGSFANAKVALLLIIPLFRVISGAFELFMILIFVRAILSWFATAAHNPLTLVIAQLTEPLLARCRKLLPATGGFDFSPIIALLGLLFVSRLIEYYLYPLLGALAA